MLRGLGAVLLLGLLGAASGSPSLVREHPPGANLSTPELIALQGYPVEIHHVTTEDGCILEMHRIPHGINETASTGRPVAFLQHGLLSSSADWIMNSPDRAFAYMVADAGYDVWLGNFRGNTYSKRHASLNPDEDLDYWSFSWDEMGLTDLPAMMDYALASTGQPDLIYAGFSMGTTTYFALMSARPDYADKVRLMVALAPPVFMEDMKGVLAWLAPYSDDLDMILSLLGVGEFLPHGNLTTEWVELYCDEEAVTAEVCYNLLFLIAGPDPALLNKEYLPLILTHVPAGTSVHTVNHYAQLYMTAGFSMYDWGLLRNQNHYGQSTPPDYDLTNVVGPVGIFWGQNDWLATPSNVVRLEEQLPNIVLNYRVPYDNFTHIDFIWATIADELVYGSALELMDQYPTSPTAAAAAAASLRD